MRVSPANQFSVQLFANQAGQVNVKLEVTPTSSSPYIFRDGFSLVDELQIKVYNVEYIAILHFIDIQACNY